MARKHLDKTDIEELQFYSRMKLVEGIVLHILDSVSISRKWKNKNISMKVLLAKKHTLQEMHKWMKTWQWSIWVNIYSEYFEHNNKLIKKKFENIRRRSISEVNKRINKYEKQEEKIQDKH